jgi:hypothetical protein
MAKRARICFTNCSKMGLSCTRPLATGLRVTAKGFCSTKSMGGGGVFYGCAKLGTQSAVISQPRKHCATQPQRLLYFIRKFCRTVQHGTYTGTCAVPVLPALCSSCACTVLVPALCLHHVLLHSHAAPRRTPLPCPALCAVPVHSPFGGQKPVITLYRGYIKRGCFWPKK